MTDNGPSTLTEKAENEMVPAAEGREGFSLIELLVVIVIIGVIAAIGTPQLLGMRTRSSVRADAREIHSSLRKAQTEAVKRSEDVCVKINGALTPNEYEIYLADYFTTLSTKELRAGNSFFNNGLTGPDPCFNQRGLPNVTVPASVELHSSGTSMEMIVTLSPSGHVKSTNK